MSQSSQEDLPSYDMPPEKVVEEALRNKCQSIAYTYNDPIIFLEYAVDIAKLAKKKGLKNIFVTNGFINEKPLRDACKYMDAFHVDLKGFDDRYYKELCHAWLSPVLKTLKVLKEEKRWFEMINLVIPGYNDRPKEFKEMSDWIVKNLGKDYPLHFSRFYPFYRMQNIPPTREETLIKAKDIAEKAGLKYVYIGNVMGREDNTFCPKCKKTLIKRTSYFQVLENKLNKGRCFSCNEKIAGVWD
jgi:pyruvate formate lyase activating enzyme